MTRAGTWVKGGGIRLDQLDLGRIVDKAALFRQRIDQRFVFLLLGRRQGRAWPDEVIALILEPLRRTINLVHGVTEVVQVTHRVSLFCSPCHSSSSALHSGHGRFWSCASHHGGSLGGSR